MSGAKRKSGYRKGVTNAYDCEDDPKLGENDVIAKVFALVSLLFYYCTFFEITPPCMLDI